MKRRDGHDEVVDYLIKHYWSTLEEPWTPGFDMTVPSLTNRRTYVHIHIPGPTWLDEQIMLLDEALTIFRKR